MTGSSPPPDGDPVDGNVAATPPGAIQPGEEEAGLEGDEVVDGELEPDRRLSRPESFAGPLPPPNVLDEYDHVVPGLKNDIVDQWKAETAHRHQTIDGMRSTDVEAMRAYYEGEKRGQFLGFLVLLGVLVIAGLSIVLEQAAVGVAGIVMAGAAAVWQLRRNSLSETSPPPDVGNGDDIEKLPPSEESPQSQA